MSKFHSKQKYVDYVYLKPHEMREIYRKEKERKDNERLDGQGVKKKVLRLSDRRKLKPVVGGNHNEQQQQIQQ